MIIDVYRCKDNKFLRWELIEKARQRYKPLPKCSMGYYAMMFINEKEKQKAIERDKEFEDAVKIINEILEDNDESK